MLLKKKLEHIARELKSHIPFTAVGALFGIIFMLVFKSLSNIGTHRLFIIFHPGHVILSAMVTSSMFRLHSTKKKFLTVLLVGYVGSIGIATLSDVIIPHFGAELLGLNIPSHAEVHSHSGENDAEEHEHIPTAAEQKKVSQHLHLGFIEDWYIVNPAAVLGVLIAYFFPKTKFPHAGHVLIGTWASSAYLLMNMQSSLGVVSIAGIFLTLFISTWLPCCISDIIFPLLLVKDPEDIESSHC